MFKYNRCKWDLQQEKRAFCKIFSVSNFGVLPEGKRSICLNVKKKWAYSLFFAKLNV